MFCRRGFDRSRLGNGAPTLSDIIEGRMIADDSEILPAEDEPIRAIDVLEPYAAVFRVSVDESGAPLKTLADAVDVDSAESGVGRGPDQTVVSGSRRGSADMARRSPSGCRPLGSAQVMHQVVPQRSTQLRRRAHAVHPRGGAARPGPGASRSASARSRPAAPLRRQSPGASRVGLSDGQKRGDDSGYEQDRQGRQRRGDRAPGLPAPA